MNNNRVKHKILKHLSISYVAMKNDNLANPEYNFGLSYERLQLLIKEEDNEAFNVFQYLNETNEVGVKNIGFDGLYLTSNGYISFAEEKYLKRNQNILLKFLKNVVQILIPILSLIIAITALTIKNSKLEKRIENIEKVVGKQH
ncbi:hypothetical protein [Kaistella jeonii]|uniref:Uncharacterized protein n=1 Tax=Kaistella jeonii TaxID=266749 RepID=A0A0C1D3N0_9FLAO|nr:hypothetical protein [Kaistella jeonii]KIA88415.1 hypothetical protein OA86_10255 [Kaistella jeonii]SFC16419.1 hypothetical protein SAMN05421876_1089 [Kaistella jeonii]VEI95377.1 Uncharacterised protein [Kaistella jeonii]